MATMNAPTPPPLLLTAHTGGVLRLVLNRPQARNALSSELMAAIQAALAGAAQDNATRVIVIAAEGPVFSSGHDLKEMARHRADGDGRNVAESGHHALVHRRAGRFQNDPGGGRRRRDRHVLQERRLTAASPTRM